MVAPPRPTMRYRGGRACLLAPMLASVAVPLIARAVGVPSRECLAFVQMLAAVVAVSASVAHTMVRVADPTLMIMLGVALVAVGIVALVTVTIAFAIVTVITCAAALLFLRIGWRGLVLRIRLHSRR